MPASLGAGTCPVSETFDTFSPEYLANPYAVFATARAQGPVVYAPALDMWLITRYDEVEAVLRDPETFSSRNVGTPWRPLAPEAAAVLAEGYRPTPSLAFCDPPDHDRIRALNNLAFSPRRAALLEPRVRAVATALVDDMIAGPPEADLVEALAFPLPAQVIFALLGFPEEDTQRLKAYVASRVDILWGQPAPETQVAIAESMVAYFRYCQEIVAARLDEPGNDFLSDLARAHRENPEAISPAEIVSVAFALSSAGHETTTNALVNAVHRLLGDRQQWDLLVEAPGLIPRAVEEALRFDSSIIAWRRVAVTDTKLSGVAIPAGAQLLLLLGSANRDPDVFPEADRFDIRREPARPHIAFGKGIHFCLGATLARQEMRVALELLTSRLPGLRLADDDFPATASLTLRRHPHLRVAWD